MDADARDRPSSLSAASAKRSLRAAIDGTPDRKEPGRTRGNNEGPSRPDNVAPSLGSGAAVSWSRLPVRDLASKLDTVEQKKPCSSSGLF
eukprot:3441136-Pleurochrysis_carterae.AAC.4